MAVDITLQDPDNASNPTALEQVIAENNAAIVAAFQKVLSREETDSENFLWTDLDLNGYKLLNVGESVFLTREDVSQIEAGEFRKNPTTGDLEYRGPDDTDWVVLYTAAELQGPPGNDGAGIGDLVAANNLSELTNTATARTNLGLQIGTDVLAYDADLASFDPSTKVDQADSRFSRYNSISFSSNRALDTWGNLYVFDSVTASQSLTVSTGTLGDVATIYVAPGSQSLTLARAGSVEFFLTGTTVAETSLTILEGGFVTLVCVSSDGNKFVVSGTQVS